MSWLYRPCSARFPDTLSSYPPSLPRTLQSWGMSLISCLIYKLSFLKWHTGSLGWFSWTRRQESCENSKGADEFSGKSVRKFSFLSLGWPRIERRMKHTGKKFTRDFKELRRQQAAGVDGKDAMEGGGRRWRSSSSASPFPHASPGPYNHFSLSISNLALYLLQETPRADKVSKDCKSAQRQEGFLIK